MRACRQTLTFFSHIRLLKKQHDGWFGVVFVSHDESQSGRLFVSALVLVSTTSRGNICSRPSAGGVDLIYMSCESEV